MQFPQFTEWAFLGVVSGGVILIYQMLRGINVNLREMNIKMAIILEKTAYHERELTKLEQRIIALENKCIKNGVLNGSREIAANC